MNSIPLLSIVSVEGRQGVVRARAEAVAGCPARYDVMFGTEIVQSIEPRFIRLIRGPTTEELSRIVSSCDAAGNKLRMSVAA